MSHQYQPEDVDIENEGNLRILNRAITLSQGEFSLILLRCNYSFIREQIVQKLRDRENPDIITIDLPPHIKTLYTNIAEQFLNQQPPALMVLGLESVENIDTVLTAANQVREQFRNNFHFPLLLWVNDEVLKKMIRLAPDLKNWATMIEFTSPSQQLISFVKQKTDAIFAGNITPSQRIFWELATAEQDLQYQGQILDSALQASLKFAFGLQNSLDNNLDTALNFYQESLKFWQENNYFNYLERAGIVLLNIGLVYDHQGEINNDIDSDSNNQQSWQLAKDYYQQALDSFKQAQRLDLVAKYISYLGAVLKKLKLWKELKNIAEIAITLHENDASMVQQLAQDYSFLAEIALEEKRWNDAKELAQISLDKLSNLTLHETGLYYFLLARSYQGLDDINGAILHLELARKKSHHRYNPQLYISILNLLNSLYFQQSKYLEAFEIKQERLQIEQQYGLRAFVGASYINPQRQAINSTQLEPENTGKIAPEIYASGREIDVKRLCARISGTQDKLTVIHGQSGVGKSSILQGGLIPALQQQPIEARNALPILLRAYTDWVGILGRALAQNITSLDANFLKSPDAIIEELRKNAERNLLTVLIFDQFEEFFFVYQDQGQRKQFYDFLRMCFNIPFVKIVFSLREDYLHYLLEFERLFDVSVINNNILDKSIRYYLGNFSPADAKAVIKTLTEKTRFYLQAELIDELVKDLAGDIGEVRPIELQIVGSQLQTEQIKTLDKYQAFGNKEKLVEKFLEDVIKDCGAENEQIARLVLYLLTDENGTRPLKTRAELAEQLVAETKTLDLILQIFVASGLVLLLPESPADRYQLVHDYLVDFIRQQQGNELLEELVETKKQLKEAEEARQILSDAKQKAEHQIQKANFRSACTLGVTVIFSVLVIILAGYAGQQLKTVESEVRNLLKSKNHAEQKLKSLNQEQMLTQNKLSELQTKTQELENKKNSAENKAKAADKKQKASNKKLRKAQFELQNIQRQADKLAQENKQAQKRIKQAITKADIAEEKSQQAEAKQREAISQAKKAEEIRKEAQAALTTAYRATKKAETEQKEALQGTNLERAGVNSLRQFEYEALPSLISAIKNGKELKNIVKDGRPLEKYPAFSPIYALNTIIDNIKERNQLVHQDTDTVLSVSFSPDGKTIATASADKTARLWNLQGQLLQEFKGHQGWVHSVSFSPDGKTIATASADKTARLWNLQGQLLQEFKGHQDSVNSVSFSPDGKTIATASDDKTARLWNLQGQLLQEFKGHQSYVRSVSFSHDGKTIATASLDKTALLWDLQGKLLREFKGHQVLVWSVSFSPDGQIIATASSDGTVRLWDLQGKLLREFKGHQVLVWSVSFSPDGKTIATASLDKTVRLWDLQGQLLQELKGHQGAVLSVSFSPDGRSIATASADQTARLWNLQKQQIRELKGHQGGVNSVSFSPDGKTIATASNDKTARLWNLQGQQIRELKGRYYPIFGVNFSPEGKNIAKTSSGKTARLWNLQGQELIWYESEVNSVSFSPDGKTIVTASADKKALLWNLQGQLLQEFIGHQGGVNSVSFSPDGKTIATASDDQTARLWNLQGQLLQEFIGHQGGVNSVSFSPDGKTIATASDDQTARLWNLQGQLLQEFIGHQGGVNSVSFSPDGKTIATASSDGTARLWNLQGQRFDFAHRPLIQEFIGHQGGVNSVSFSPDGKTIVTASWDYTARLWNLQGQLIQELKGHQDSVNSVSFSPDGQTIATASDDQTARLWPVRDLDRALKDGCAWLQDYLQNHVGLSEEDKKLCNDIRPVH
jgi:WD40 repeat protein